MEGFLYSGGLLWLLVWLTCTESQMQENIYASGCSGDEVSLECAEHHRIAIKRLFFGVKRSWDCQQIPRKHGCCQADHKDCVINDDSKYPTLNTHCSGYQRCKFLVQKIPTSNRCGNAPYTDYMTVIYDCVPGEVDLPLSRRTRSNGTSFVRSSGSVSNVLTDAKKLIVSPGKTIKEKDIAMFCGDETKRGKALYLANTEYPQTMDTQKADCMCMVRTVQGSEGVNIHSIDVLLAWAQHPPRSCSKELAIKDEEGYRWDIQCGHIGYYGFRTIYTKPVQNVTLTLSSSSSKGSAFVWLQTKATDDEDELEIFCGEPLRLILLRARQEAEARHRNRNNKSHRTTPANDKDRTINSTRPFQAHSVSLSSNLAAIIGGIVAAGLVLISLVIIAITVHCKRVQLAKKSKEVPLNLYPAVTNGEATHLTSYCRYDYDDDHYSSINRSPLKMTSLTDSDIGSTHTRPKEFVTLARAEANHYAQNGHVREDAGDELILSNYVLQSPTLPRSPPSSPHPCSPIRFSPPSSPVLGCSSPGFSSSASSSSASSHHPPSPPPLPAPLHNVPSASLAVGSLRSDPTFSGHLSLRLPRPAHGGQMLNSDIYDGHKTLPDNRHGHKILVSGPKSPLGKRNKSVTFSQPVAMVTPLPSGSQESVDSVEEEEEEEEEGFGKGSPTSSPVLGNYDNLNKIVIPDQPLSPSLIHHTLPFHGVLDGGYHVNSHGNGVHELPPSLSTFRLAPEEREGRPLKDCNPVLVNLPPPPLPVLNGDTCAVLHKKPVPQPVFHPQKQNAELYETGV